MTVWARKGFGTFENRSQGPFSRKSRNFQARTVIRKTPTRLFCKAGLLICFCCKKTERTAKFDGLEPWRCEDITGIAAPEISPKS